MAQISSQKSLIIVGGGIVGLCIAVAALSRGHQVTVIAKDAPEDIASGVAAGMIAPAMEAMSDPDPVMSFQRLKAAQAVWLDLFDVWPERVKAQLATSLAAPVGTFVWDQSDAPPSPAEIGFAKLSAMKADFVAMSFDSQRVAGIDPETHHASIIKDDWLVEAGPLLAALQADISQKGGRLLMGRVVDATALSVTLSSGDVLAATHVVIAAGYDASAFSGQVPCLAHVQPIKGHLLDLPHAAAVGVIRAPQGYWARYDGSAKFGATMQSGQADRAIEPAVVAELTRRAQSMAVDVTGLDQATPRVGIRASTPDGWPLIGRDGASGVLVATGMRRNGYVFAPLAARIVLGLIDGQECPDDQIYSPDRF